MGLQPTLAESIEPALLSDLVEDDNVCFEQKLDGKRLMIVVENGVVSGINRNNVVALDPEIAFTIQNLNRDLTLDGEVLNGKFYIFDVPEVLDVISPSAPYSERRMVLHALTPFLESPKIQILPSFTKPDDKLKLIEWCHNFQTEGIMVKRLNVEYYSGQRSSAWLKAKMVKTCEVFVTGMMIDGKRNASVAMYDSAGTELSVGTVTMTDRRLKTVQVGTVLEVRYLYASDDSKLVQPHVLKLRPDKRSSECNINQLVFTDKTKIYERTK